MSPVGSGEVLCISGNSRGRNMAGVLEEKQESVEGRIISTMRRADPGSPGEDWSCCFVMGAIGDL